MSSQQNGLVAANKQNEPGGGTPKNRSTFPLSYSFYMTERFAEYTPFFVMDAVDADHLPFQSNHEVQTNTLKSPILQSLSKKKDYFSVPMQAILPLNWEKFYTQPVIGEDVPSDTGPSVSGFWGFVRSAFLKHFDHISNDAPGTASGFLNELFHFLLFYEQFYSSGSLLTTLGIRVGYNCFRAFRTMPDNSFKSTVYDEFFDSIIGFISAEIVSGGFIDFRLGSDNYRIVASPRDYPRQNTQEITIREALELMRDDMSFEVFAAYQVDTQGLNDDVLREFTVEILATDSPLNLSKLWAYQLVCSHYYSNDHIDYIYSAELFRQYIYSLIDGPFGVELFNVNSFSYQYDYLSGHYCSRFLEEVSSADAITQLSSTYLAYFTALLSFRRSLRFMDYFTGTRSRPLAVGDAAVDVNENRVNIIDLSVKSMFTKFLQAVNRSGRKFGAYLGELFGKVPAYDFHNPCYLAHTSDMVSASETENTGAAQMADTIAVTSRLRASSARYAFEFNPDRDSIIIGVSYYDLPRVYSRATERQNFYLDRFDFFNPYLQFIGDQPVYEAEIGTDTPTLAPFSYTNRFMEYKQRYNQCAGGFGVPSTGLDNWIFLADSLRRKYLHHIGPSFIRSFNSEIDHFYQRLTGYSLGTYYHFICRYDNRMNASRPMAYNPTLVI